MIAAVIVASSIVNLLIGYFVGTILNTELGWAGDRSAI